MSAEFTITYTDQPEWAIIGGGINDYNNAAGGETNAKNLCFILRGPDEQIVGGVIGSTYYEWLHVDLMWIKQEFRGQGFGRQLLLAAEAEARERGAKNAFLDTFSFQAPGFYQKHGYIVIGELPDFPPGHQRYFMSKAL